MRVFVDYAEIQAGETVVDVVERLIVDQLGVPIEDIHDVHPLVT